MSEEKDDDTNTIKMLSASCGVAEVDDIKLKDCDDCDLVRYCGVKCQKDHRPQHEEECKKREAELRDEILFKQPESSHLGDCPICCVPLPLDPETYGFYSCCSKTICNGCYYANQFRGVEGILQATCPFCRNVMPTTKGGMNELLTKRIAVNDPVAICEMGAERCKEGDFRAANEYYRKAAALGDVHSHYQLSVMYHYGNGVDKDEEKELYHLKEAAIAGHPYARYNLACFEGRNGQHNRAAKHFIIAAKLGDDYSLKYAKEMYKAGHVSKEDFAAALRGHHAAIKAMKSPQREQAAGFLAELERRGMSHFR